MTSPLVSILMPCHKAGKFIGDALRSIARQSHGNWELLAVDDCGPEDGTREAVEALAREQSNNLVRYVRHDENHGASIARQTALSHARGQYIAFLDSDDAYLPEKLERSVEILNHNCSIAFVHGPARVIGEPAPATKEGIAFYLGDKNYSYNLAETEDFLRRCNICNSTVVCRATALSTSDFTSGMIFQNEDWVLWNRIARRGLACYEAEPLTLYRYHPCSFSFRADRRPGTWELAQLEMLACSMGEAKDIKTRAAIGLEIMGCVDRLSFYRTTPGKHRVTARRCLIPALLMDLSRRTRRLFSQLADKPVKSKEKE